MRPDRRNASDTVIGLTPSLVAIERIVGREFSIGLLYIINLLADELRFTKHTPMPRILLTTTSFQDTPGEHHRLLAETGWEIITARGPLNEADTLALVGDIDGYICGDDMITRKVLEKALPRLKVLSKYGIGVDKIDVKSCTEFGLPLLFTPGVNHTTVAEHCFLLLLALE